MDDAGRVTPGDYQAQKPRSCESDKSGDSVAVCIMDRDLSPEETDQARAAVMVLTGIWSERVSDPAIPATTCNRTDRNHPSHRLQSGRSEAMAMQKIIPPQMDRRRRGRRYCKTTKGPRRVTLEWRRTVDKQTELLRRIMAAEQRLERLQSMHSALERKLEWLERTGQRYRFNLTQGN
jgi:hypothetical protein